MAAGLGFKTFTTGEVLTAADTNGYLMQGVLVFASAAARDAAITSPQEGQFAYTKDTNGLWYYDGAAWVASGATGDIEGVTAGIGISGGGTSGTVTVTNSMATAIDAKGDLVAGTGADAFSRLAVGANDTVLTADSTAGTGLKWATVGAPAFKGVQVYRTSTNQNISNATNTLIEWNAENFDSDSYHDNSTNPGRLTVPAGLGGKYYVYHNYQLYCGACVAITRIYKNGTQVQLAVVQAVGGGVENTMQLGLTVDLAATDYVESYVYQSGGSTGTVNGTAGASYSAFGMYRVGV
jgi:hypothetical protein